jgi:hypothetical protein
MKDGSNDVLAPLVANGCLTLVQEYCQLAVRSQLSEVEADRMETLLTLAETNGCLDFWFHEVDHFLDHALGLGSATQVYASVNENLKARLRELVDIQATQGIATNETVLELLDDLWDGLERGEDLDSFSQASRN